MESVGLAPCGESALRLERTEQRPHLAGQLNIAELELSAARRIAERNPAARDRERVDGKPVRIEGKACGRHFDVAGPIEADGKVQAVDGDIGSAKFAAHERAKPELHRKPAGGELM